MSDKKGERDDIGYHHYSLTFDPSQIGSKFRDVRFVLVAGCEFRAENQALYLAEHTFNGSAGPKEELERLTKPKSRFVLFKLGPVLISNHGMGPASMSIALHELFLMCQQAGVIKQITLIRFGTCGGIGVNPGTICVTKRALDSLFLDYVELKICAKLVRRPCGMDNETAVLLEQLAINGEQPEQLGDFDIRSGATVSTSDFYEEQGRTNGAICDHTQAEKMQFLEKARELGVINMEMESNHLAAMCHKLGVSFGVACVALNNRLREDKVKLTPAEFSIFEQRLFWLNHLFISHKLGISKP